ncbi:Transmembrane protein 18 [Carabus blaptoides fortunei]
METEFILNHIDGFISYIWSIDWKDPWLIGLLTFHIIVTLMALLTRNYGNFQVVLFLVLLLLVYFSESINEIASSNWKVFSRQQYFDSKGMFISIVFSIPILLNCMLMVGSWLWQSTQLMTKLKKAQLREKRKRESNRQEMKED